MRLTRSPLFLFPGLATLHGCFLFVDFTTAPCLNLIVDDELMFADPPDVFPDDGFDLHWQERATSESEGGTPTFSEVSEELTLRDPITGDVLVALNRVVPAPAVLSSPGGTPSSIAFSEFTALPEYVPQDYIFHVELLPLPPLEAADVCPPDPEFDVTGEFPLVLACDCDGFHSYGLRVADAATNPPSPIPAGTPIDLVWTNVYDGIPCTNTATIESGEFQASITVTGAPGTVGPIFFDVPSLPAGTSDIQQVSMADILGAARPVGTYVVTLSLDSAGLVPECTSNGDIDTTDQVVQFSFEVVP